MPYLGIEFDDVDYAALRERSQAKGMELRFYAADIITLSIHDRQRLDLIEQEMTDVRVKRVVLYPPEVDALIARVKDLVTDVAPHDFDAASWVVSWLKRPTPALGGRKPNEYLDTEVGRRLLSTVLDSMALGAFWYPQVRRSASG